MRRSSHLTSPMLRLDLGALLEGNLKTCCCNQWRLWGMPLRRQSGLKLPAAPRTRAWKSQILDSLLGQRNFETNCDGPWCWMTQSGVNWTQAQQPMRLRSKTSPTNVQLKCQVPNNWVGLAHQCPKVAIHILLKNAGGPKFSNTWETYGQSRRHELWGSSTSRELANHWFQ